MSVPSASVRSILLVEDDQMVREIIALFLEDGYDVLQATTIAAARKHLQAPDAPPIELILADCLLPDGSVIDLLGLADQKNIPVVLISGDPRQAEAMDPTRPFLPKPFTQELLLAVLDTARR
jgi:DNA-binding NtrC family response regulator